MAIVVDDDRILIQAQDVNAGVQLLAIQTGKQIIVVGWSLTFYDVAALIRLRFVNAGATVSKYISGHYPKAATALSMPWVYHAKPFRGPVDFALGLTSGGGVGALCEGHIQFELYSPSP